MLPLILLSSCLIVCMWLARSYHALKTLRSVPSVPKPADQEISRAKISVLIPARNEEKNLAGCLPSLLRQADVNWECLVANDRSSDGTETVLKNLGFQPVAENTAFSGKAGVAPTARYLNILQPGPAEWSGKNHALAKLVPHAQGDWFLFTDADTLHEPCSIRAAVVHAEKYGLEFLSLLPRCITGTALERIIQPTAMGFMGLWFPLFRVNDPQDPLFFANGQFLLIRRTLYEKLGGHAAVAAEYLEDFALMQKAKNSGAACACHFGPQIYGTRMYRGFAEIWRGWRRIYRHAATDCVPVLLRWWMGVFAGSVLPFVLMGMLMRSADNHSAMAGTAWALVLLAAGIFWGTAATTYGMLRVPKKYALFHPLAALILTGILTDALRLVLFKRSTRWRG